jgi:hypothetical protein
MPENPSAQNPELGLGDLLRLAQALTEVVLTGGGEVPVVKMRIAGRNVKLGPIPITVE